jgi:hypothetical protein
MPTPTVTNHTPSGVPLGVGSQLAYEINGDILANDSLFIALEVDRVGTPTQIQFGIISFVSAHAAIIANPLMWVGFYAKYETGQPYAIGGGGDWPGVGESVTLHARYVRGISVVVDFTTSGYSWHGDAGLHNLFYLLNRLPTSTADDALLAAVTHTYRNLP